VSLNLMVVERIALTELCSLFGKEGTPYDFKNVNITQVKEKCAALEAQMKGMKKSVDKAAMATLDQCVHLDTYLRVTDRKSGSRSENKVSRRWFQRFCAIK
jgi:hypothetical protein